MTGVVRQARKNDNDGDVEDDKMLVTKLRVLDIISYKSMSKSNRLKIMKNTVYLCCQHRVSPY